MNFVRTTVRWRYRRVGGASLALAILLCAAILLSGCQGRGSAPGPGAQGAGEAAPTPPAAAPPTPVDPVKERLAQLSMEEKLGQLLLIGIDGETVSEQTRSLLNELKPGGLIFYKPNIRTAPQTLALLNGLKEANRSNPVPLWLSTDEEGGRVTRLPAELAHPPTARAVGKANNAQAAYALGEAIAGQLAAFGMQVDFAPVLDVDSNPANPVIGDRSYGATAAAVEQSGIAVMQGLTAGRVLPVVKHFPGHGDTSVDSHLGLPIVEHELSRLRSLELQPFAAAFAKGAPAVMVAHILLPKLDKEYPASLSKPIITDLLRTEMGFSGVVFTDDLTMGAIVQKYELGEAAVRAIEAGADVLLVGHGAAQEREALQAVRAAITNGRLTEARIEESAYRILKLKAQYELKDEPIQTTPIEKANEAMRQAIKQLGR